MDVLPVAPIRRWSAPLRRFLHVEAASGVVLLAATAAALALANSVWGPAFAALWKAPVSVSAGGWTLAGDTGHLVVNDGLMALFFFVVGLEIKRELALGELRELRKALLPAAAALGGILVPAAVYLSLLWGRPGQRGWAVPMATDIAFVVGILSLFGRRVPHGLKVALLTLAIVDDLGAVLVIAVAFSGGLDWGWLAAAGAALGMIHGLNRAGLRAVGAYVVLGAGVWLAVYLSGVHATVAGVALGLLTPVRAWVRPPALAAVAGNVGRKASAGDEPSPADARRLEFAARESVSPLHRLEATLHPWVAFGVMPLFALANAGIVVRPEVAGDPVAAAVAAGLVVGKPLGIVAFAWAAVRLGWAALPAGVTWGMMAAGGCLAGVGFTMSLFLAGLAFPPTDQGADSAAAAKFGTLAASAAAATLGSGLLLLATRGGARSGAVQHESEVAAVDGEQQRPLPAVNP